jgi:hypothetical protein
VTRVLVAVIALNLSLTLAEVANAHWKPGRHNAVHAIKTYFGKDWREAANVAYCEAGEFHWLTTRRPWDAGNGQYRGMFQMGSHERSTYGHGSGPWAQAQAASRYYRASGSDWSPWECKPWWKPMPHWLIAS